MRRHEYLNFTVDILVTRYCCHDGHKKPLESIPGCRFSGSDSFILWISDLFSNLLVPFMVFSPYFIGSLLFFCLNLQAVLHERRCNHQPQIQLILVLLCYNIIVKAFVSNFGVSCQPHEAFSSIQLSHLDSCMTAVVCDVLYLIG